jgi:general secretion pathway protein K
MEKNRKGFVLILVLIVVSGMTTIVVAGVYRTKIAIRLAHANSRRNQAYYLAIGGIEKAKALLASEELTAQRVGQICGFISDAGFEGLLAEQTGGNGEDMNMKLSYYIRDELGFFNINNSDPACWENIPGASRDMRSCIVDWIDGDDDTSPSGAESDYYERLERPYGCKNRPMTRLRELCYVKNISSDMYRG